METKQTKNDLQVPEDGSTMPMTIMVGAKLNDLRTVLSTKEDVILLELPQGVTGSDARLVVGLTHSILFEFLERAFGIKRIDIKNPTAFDCTHIMKRDDVSGGLKLDLLVRTAEEAKAVFEALGVPHTMSA